MELYNFYQIAYMTLYTTAGMFTKNEALLVAWSALIGVCLWTAAFILQGIGLFVMAKKRGMKRKWMAFVPFVNIYYMGKLAEECSFFGHKMKNAGVYAMVAQILATMMALAFVLAECYLYYNHGAPQRENTLMTPYWPGLSGFSLTVSKFYDYGGYVLPIFSLITQLLLLILTMALYKKYTPKNYRLWAMIVFFMPVARFVIIFCMRNRQAVDYEAYIQKRREEFARRQQEYYNTRGGRPPYGSPYGMGGYQGNPTPPSEPKPDDEPFGEFSSDKNKSEGEKSDDFFR